MAKQASVTCPECTRTFTVTKPRKSPKVVTCTCGEKITVYP
jgi:hypothetical protein